MSWLRDDPEDPTRWVDVVLRIDVRGSDAPADGPSDPELVRWAAEQALRSRDSRLRLSDHAPVRTVVRPGQADLSIQLMRAQEAAPGLTGDLLEERGLEPWRYDIEVWTEDRGADRWFVWAAAARE